MFAERRSQLLMALGAVVAGGLALAFLDLNQLMEAWKELKYGSVAAAGVTVIISLVLGSRGLASVIRRPWSPGLNNRRVFPITVMSQVASNLFSFGGLTGATMRARLLAGKEGLWAQGIAGAVTYSLAVNATSLAFCFASTLLLIVGISMPGAPWIAGLLPLAVASGFVVLVSYKGVWISKKAGGLASAVEAKLKSQRLAAKVSELLQRSFADSRGLAETTAWLMAEWFVVAGALGFCFHATGHPISFELIITCYGSGALATLLSFIPGGIGVLEASMAGVAVHFGGVPQESAVVAVLLYRALYYGLPIPLSLTGLGSAPALPENETPAKDQSSVSEGEAKVPEAPYNDDEGKTPPKSPGLEVLDQGEAPA